MGQINDLRREMHAEMERIQRHNDEQAERVRRDNEEQAERTRTEGREQTARLQETLTAAIRNAREEEQQEARVGEPFPGLRPPPVEDNNNPRGVSSGSSNSRRRRRGKRKPKLYNVGPRFSDDDEPEDLTNYVGMPWYQAGIRGRTRMRNAELYQLAQRGKEEQERLAQEYEDTRTRRNQLRRDRDKAEEEARRPGLRLERYRQARDRAEGIGNGLKEVENRLVDLANRLRTMEKDNAASLALRRKELGCSSLATINGYGHPGTKVQFDVKTMPMFEGKSGEDPQEWEQRVRDLCHENNLYGRALIGYMNQRIGPDVKKAMQGFSLKPGADRNDPSQWLEYFRSVYSPDTLQAHYEEEFKAATQKDPKNYDEFLNSLKYAYIKGHPTALPLEHDRQGVETILYQFFEGMDPGPNDIVRSSVFTTFFLNVDDYLQKPPEEAFMTPDITGRVLVGGEKQRAPPRSTVTLPRRGSKTRKCNHCGSLDHLARRCPQAIAERRETVKEITEMQIVGELPTDEWNDLQEENSAELTSDVKEVEAQAALCFECNQPGHFRRDCPQFLRRMRMTAGRFRTGAPNRQFSQTRQPFTSQGQQQYPQSPSRFQQQYQQPPRRERVWIEPAAGDVPDDILRNSQMQNKDAFWERMDLKMQQACERAMEQGPSHPARQTIQNHKMNTAPRQTVAAATGQVEGKIVPTTSKNA
jgi:hypothetical protein